MKSRSATGRQARMSERLSVSVGLIVLGLVSQTVLPSTHVLTSANSTADGVNQSSAHPPNAGNCMPLLTSGESRQTSIYATTFYPSTIDHQVAVQVPAQAYGATPIQIELVRVKGARLAGSVVSRSRAPTSGMDVRLFHRFGDFGSESSVAVVSANGMFEILRVPPGWYRLTVSPRATASNDRGRQFATTLIEVRDGRGRSRFSCRCRRIRRSAPSFHGPSERSVTRVRSGLYSTLSTTTVHRCVFCRSTPSKHTECKRGAPALDLVAGRPSNVEFWCPSFSRRRRQSRHRKAAMIATESCRGQRTRKERERGRPTGANARQV